MMKYLSKFLDPQDSSLVTQAMPTKSSSVGFVGDSTQECNEIQGGMPPLKEGNMHPHYQALTVIRPTRGTGSPPEGILNSASSCTDQPTKPTELIEIPVAITNSEGYEPWVTYKTYETAGDTHDSWPCDPSILPPSAFRAWPPRAPELASWSDDWRERWGRRTNGLIDAGSNWRIAEQIAFIETVAERISAGLPVSALPGERSKTDVVAKSLPPPVNKPKPSIQRIAPMLGGIES